MTRIERIDTDFKKLLQKNKDFTCNNIDENCLGNWELANKVISNLCVSATLREMLFR